MATRVRWLGHACLLFESDGTPILVDPFLTELGVGKLSKAAGLLVMRQVERAHACRRGQGDRTWAESEPHRDTPFPSPPARRTVRCRRLPPAVHRLVRSPHRSLT